MAITNLFAIKLATMLLANYNKVHVFPDLMNRDYVGDAKYGGTVKISSVGRVSIKDYTPNAGAGGTAASPTIAGIDRPEILQSSSQFLSIDQRKYFNFEIDDDEESRIQTNVLSETMKEAAYGMANTVDLFCNSTLQTGVAGTANGNGNRLTARTIGTSPGDDDPYQTLLDLATKLKEADVYGEYWVVIPPWYTAMLLNHPFIVGNEAARAQEALTNGRVTRLAGLDIRESNNLSGATSGTLAVAGGVYTVLAGVKQAATFADLVDKIERFRPQDGFNDAVKGLHTYGAKVTRPYALASVACTKA